MSISLKKLPLGLSHFPELIRTPYLYVDKTEGIYQLITSGKYYFLARPRRFGKSLLVSTIEEIFKGNRELFKDLWIGQSDYSWTQHPVISLSLASIDHQNPARLEQSLSERLIEIAEKHRVKLKQTTSAIDQLYQLITNLSQQASVVLLIDEYDQPIISHLQAPKIASANRD
jgi:hypothetical protein